MPEWIGLAIPSIGPAKIARRDAAFGLKELLMRGVRAVFHLTSLNRHPWRGWLVVLNKPAGSKHGNVRRLSIQRFRLDESIEVRLRVEDRPVCVVAHLHPLRIRPRCRHSALIEGAVTAGGQRWNAPWFGMRDCAGTLSANALASPIESNHAVV
jgi:hypothetical protein